MSALATAGAAAWVVPEILTAKPAAGAPMLSVETAPAPPASGVSTAPASGVSAAPPTGVSTAASTVQPSGPTSGVTTAAATQPTGPLAYSGVNIQRDVEIGAALVAGGWAMQHWASRTPKPAADGQIEGRSAGDPS
jgi:hypothetical protein